MSNSLPNLRSKQLENRAHTSAGGRRRGGGGLGGEGDINATLLACWLSKVRLFSICSVEPAEKNWF